MKYPHAMNFQALKRGIYEEVQKGNMEIVHADADSITVLDFTKSGDDPKEFTFTNPKTIDVRWLRRHIWIHPSISILLDDIASTLMEMDPNTFITMRHLVILPRLENLKDYIQNMIPTKQVSSLLNTAPLKCRNKNQPIGQLWNHANCAIVYLDNVKKVAAETVHENLGAWKSFHMCTWETIFHELRHLMMDCNPFLPEQYYPVHLASEEAVEAFCEEEYERIFGY